MLRKLLNIPRRRIYLDYASLTPMDPRVTRVVSEYSSHQYANPASVYDEGVAAHKALASARATVSQFIHAHADEIVFTSGGTEANALALEGVVKGARAAGITTPHIIISVLEHSSVRETARALQDQGCQVTWLPVDVTGVVSLDQLKAAITVHTVLISIMTVNNEIGSIQPIREIARIVRHARARLHTHGDTVYPLVHTDAAQAPLHQDLHVEQLGVDLLTLDSAKMYGPRGVGCLFVRRGSPLLPIIHGGGQEAGMRSGTENIPGILGFAEAITLAQADAPRSRSYQIKNMLSDGLKKIRSDISVNGAGAEASPHILNISIPGIDNELFVFRLNARGVACSTKSSCLLTHRTAVSHGSEDESYVLQAIQADSTSSLRFSFGRWTQKRDIKKVLKIIQELLMKYGAPVTSMR